MADTARLARLLAADAAMGAAGGAVTANPAAIIAGATKGLTGGAAEMLAAKLAPGKEDAARLVARAALTPFPLNVPMGVGGLLMLMGAKPTPNDELVPTEPSTGD